jgi:hypothetical protein
VRDKRKTSINLNREKNVGLLIGIIRMGLQRPPNGRMKFRSTILTVKACVSGKRLEIGKKANGTQTGPYNLL